MTTQGVLVQEEENGKYFGENLLVMNVQLHVKLWEKMDAVGIECQVVGTSATINRENQLILYHRNLHMQLNRKSVTQKSL
jgi:hypothetical protein